MTATTNTTDQSLLDFNRVVKATDPAPLPETYKCTLLEIFCDGTLAYQQSSMGVILNSFVSPSYTPNEVVIAFDGGAVFALKGNEILLNRLQKKITQYMAQPL